MIGPKRRNPGLYLLGGDPDRDSAGLMGVRESLARSLMPVNSCVTFSNMQEQSK